MTVILFAGSNFYARSHLADMIGTLAQLPTSAEVAAWAKRFQNSEDRFELPSCSVDWVTALSVTGQVDTPALTRKAWQVEHMGGPDLLRQEGCTEVWQDNEGYWHGLKAVEDKRLDALVDAPLSWPVDV